jgi:hypothetical protein
MADKSGRRIATSLTIAITLDHESLKNAPKILSDGATAESTPARRPIAEIVSAVVGSSSVSARTAPCASEAGRTSGDMPKRAAATQRQRGVDGIDLRRFNRYAPSRPIGAAVKRTRTRSRWQPDTTAVKARAAPSGVSCSGFEGSDLAAFASAWLVPEPRRCEGNALVGWRQLGMAGASRRRRGRPRVGSSARRVTRDAGHPVLHPAAGTGTTAHRRDAQAPPPSVGQAPLARAFACCRGGCRARHGPH